MAYHLKPRGRHRSLDTLHHVPKDGDERLRVEVSADHKEGSSAPTLGLFLERAIKRRLDRFVVPVDARVADDADHLIRPSSPVVEFLVENVFSRPAEAGHPLVYDDRSDLVADVRLVEVTSRQERNAHGAEEITIAHAGDRRRYA